MHANAFSHTSIEHVEDEAKRKAATNAGTTDGAVNGGAGMDLVGAARIQSGSSEDPADSFPLIEYNINDTDEEELPTSTACSDTLQKFVKRPDVVIPDVTLQLHPNNHRRIPVSYTHLRAQRDA